jgi:hypothetical protein
MLKFCVASWGGGGHMCVCIFLFGYFIFIRGGVGGG